MMKKMFKVSLLHDCSTNTARIPYNEHALLFFPEGSQFTILMQSACQMVKRKRNKPREKIHPSKSLRKLSFYCQCYYVCVSSKCSRYLKITQLHLLEVVKISAGIFPIGFYITVLPAIISNSVEKEV